ncbi:MAG: hypothetical protein Tsb002_16200 [Wenzhouxiangellaceae bacterium]
MIRRGPVAANNFPKANPTGTGSQRLLWALAGSLLLHAWLWQHLQWPRPVALETSEKWLEIELSAPEPVASAQPPPPVVPAAEAESETEASIDNTPEPTPKPATQAPTTTTTVIQATPAPGQMESWEWRSRLLDQAGTLTEDASGQDQPLTPEQPDNWTRSLLPTTGTIFDQYTPAPADTQVWRQADGTIRLETVLPNGQRLCGQAAAPDPLQPLSVSIPLWRSCGRALNQAGEQQSDPWRRPLNTQH